MPDNDAITLLNQGRLDEALQTAVSALTGIRHAAEDDPAALPELFTALQVLGDILRELGDAPAAEASYSEALDVAIRAHLPSSELAHVRTQLATLFDFSQREDQAISLYEQAISDYESMDPPESKVAAQLRNNLAMIYKGLGKYALAEQHYLRALDALEKELGHDDEEVASVYNNLGSLYYTAGFSDQAKEMFSKALKIRINLFGPYHPDVAQSYSNLATASHELGDNPTAIQYFEHALEILEMYIHEETASYEATAQDYLALLESLGEGRQATQFRKQMHRLLERA